MDVEYQLSAGVARLHLNRPQRLNAVVPSLVDGLIEALERAQAEKARVVVLAGCGRAFCAGHDLKEPTPDETMLGLAHGWSGSRTSPGGSAASRGLSSPRFTATHWAPVASSPWVAT